MRQPGERLAQKRSRRLGGVQTTRPTAESGRVGYPVGILEGGHGLLPGAILCKAPPQGSGTSQQAVVGVRQRKPRQEGESLPAIRAATAPDPNPIVILIVGLLTAAAVANDGIALANRAAPQYDLVAVLSPMGFELV